MKNKPIDNIQAETVAAFLDGNATPEENMRILDAISQDARMRELLNVSRLVDNDMEAASTEYEIIPMAAMAANSDKGNFCCLECEKYILGKLGVEYDPQQLLDAAVENGWQKSGGTALHNVGRHLESKGLVVTRRYKCSIEDIAKALGANESVIVAIDGGELIGNRAEERVEDIFMGENPDHTVVVLSYNAIDNTVTIYDPASPNHEDTYPLEQFEDAWNDSKNYLVTITFKNMKTYEPKPIDLTDVELTEDLADLREAIAENAHDVWAVERLAQGWTHGPQRDDNLKQTPCMVPYSQLPESEKKFDRDMAMNTLKLVKKLGYDIIKREDTELYRVLKKRILEASQDYHCPECKNPVYKGQVWCDKCKHELRLYWESLK